MTQRLSKRQLIADPVGYAQSLEKPLLESLLDRLDKAFHNDMDPLISDYSYEEIMDWYRDKWPKAKRLKQTGIRLGNKQEEVKLPNFMPSLLKVKPDTKEFSSYVDNYIGPYVLTDKLDGISLQIIYEGGRPTKVYTRGNGLMGKDVSRHIPNFKIPKRISTKSRIAVRAEAILNESTFQRKFSKDSGGKYTAARNTAGGFINNTKGDSTGLKSVDVIVYEMLEGPNANKKLSTQLKYMEKLGFKVVHHRTVKSIDSAKLSKYYADRVKNSKYEIDGIVVANNAPYVRRSSLPKHAKAFKENSRSDMKDVKVLKVSWELSKGGKIIPRIWYAKTTLGGVSNDKATGHNAFFVINGFRQKEIKDNKPVMPLGPGAVVRIVRSGKVIPHIVEVVKAARGRKPQMPDVPYVLRGADAYYSGERHGDTYAKQITHFFVTIGVDGLKLTSVKKLIDAGLDSVKKIIEATEEDYASIDGIGEVKAKQWSRQIKIKLKQTDAATLADASAIFIGFSKSRLDTLFSIFPSTLAMSKWTKSKVLARIHGSTTGFKKLADNFVDMLPKFIDFVEDNELILRKPKKAPKPKGNKFSTYKITFTGVRDKDLQHYIEEQGGIVQNMKSDTNMLLIKDDSYTSSKIDKANAKGIPVLTLIQFKKKFKM